MEERISQLFVKHLKTTPLSATSLLGGQVGNVFKVQTENKDYVIKFVEKHADLPFETESLDDRVYGSRWSNLIPTYEFLKKNGIATPNLYTSGTLEKEKLNYGIFDYLAGDDPDYSTEYFSVLGHHMSVIHALTRSYQGWVSMKTPYQTNWAEAFEESIRSQFQQSKQFLETKLADTVLTYINEQAPKLKSPTNFVLSHTDGIQAVFKKEADTWHLQGVIDVEDYQFTDQRFVLSGVELTNTLQEHTLPESFWEAYKTKMHVDETYDDFKTLFQIFYLLVWIRVLQGQDALVTKNIERLEQLVY